MELQSFLLNLIMFLKINIFLTSIQFHSTRLIETKRMVPKKYNFYYKKPILLYFKFL